MNTVNCIAFGTAALLSFGEALAQPQQPPARSAHPIVIGEGERRVDLAASRGRFVVVHLLPRGDEGGARAIVKTWSERGAALADFNQVFVVEGSAGEFEALMQGLPRGLERRVVRDADRASAALLGVSAAERSGEGDARLLTILLDENGREVLRQTGRADGFAEVKSAIEQRATSDAAWFNLTKGVALNGYDPVGYVDRAKAERGREDVVSTYRGVRYRFASVESREAFNRDPGKYVPAYGGWCATAVAKGDKVEIDPAKFKVTEGRLFLFYNGLWGDALKDWNRDERGLTEKADAQWQRWTRGG